MNVIFRRAAPTALICIVILVVWAVPLLVLATAIALLLVAMA